MAITKQKKSEIITKIVTGLKSANGAAFVTARQIDAKQMTSIRRDLRNAGVTYTVAKKSLMKRAFVECGIKGDVPEMPGEVAIAWSEDSIAAAKGLYAFAKIKENKEKMVLVGGIFEGSFMNKGEIMELATIPSYKELQGKFVGLLNAIPTGFVRIIDAKAQKGA